MHKQPHTPFAVEPRVFSLITCYLFYALKETTDFEKVLDHEIQKKSFSFQEREQKIGSHGWPKFAGMEESIKLIERERKKT